MAPPVTAAQLTQLRAIEESTMVDSADIISKTRTGDNAGGSTVTIATQSNVRCRRQPNLAGDVETPLGGRLVSGLQWKFAFPYGTAISTDDEIVYHPSGEKFAVMGVLGPRTLETCRRVVAVEK